MTLWLTFAAVLMVGFSSGYGIGQADAFDREQETRWWVPRMGDLGVTRETITPEQVQTITKELVEIDAALKGEPVTEEEDINY